MDATTLPEFYGLPKEVQIMIWEYAMLKCVVNSAIVSQMPARDGLPETGFTSASALTAVNVLTRELRGLSLAPAILKNRSGGTVHLDLGVDTVKAFDRSTNKSWRLAFCTPVESKHYPVRKLLCAEYSTYVSPVGNSRPFTFWDTHSQSAAYTDHHLNLNSWPLLAEFTIAYTRADSNWFLETYAVQGPDMNSVPSPDCLWHVPVAKDTFTATGGALVYDDSQEGARYYQSKDIQVDTGIRWPVDQAENPSGAFWDRRILPHDTGALTYTAAPTRNPKPSSWDYRPKIGLRGFHRNNTSCGGMWAGFRYFPDANPPRLEFSPLSWDQVKKASYACQDYDHVRGHLPEMIIKVFVVREGEEVPTGGNHTCWEEVMDAATPILPYNVLVQGSERDRLRIDAMWDLVKDKFNFPRHPWDLDIQHLG